MTKEKFEKITGYDLIEKNGILYYNGDMNLCESKIKTLPDNLIINGYLNLSFSNIKRLPEILTVENYLDLSFCKIKYLPENLTVEGGIDLSGSKIKSISNNRDFNYELNLSYTNIKSLPDNLSVNGNLYLSHTNFETLPNNLIVNGCLDLYGSKIKSLPDDLIINGDCITINNPNIKYNPEKIDFLFSKGIGDKNKCGYVLCYNIKKDFIFLGYDYSGDLNDLFEVINKSNPNFSEYKKFVEECKYYRDKYLNKKIEQ